MSIPTPQSSPPIGANAAERAPLGLFLESPMPTALVDARTRRVVSSNGALERLLGYGPGDLEGRPLRDLDTAPSEEVEEHLLLALACGDHQPRKRSWSTASGESIPVELLATRLDREQGTLLALYVWDARREGTPAESPEALRVWMKEKHEAVGQMALGLAREFEGILDRVVDTARGLPAAAAPQRLQALDEILSASRDARRLVRDLLAFTGRQVLELDTVSLNDVVAAAEDSLREALPQDIGLLLRPCAEPARVLADDDQMRRVLLQLVEHARDTMPAGGYVVVATQEVELDEAFVRDHPSTRPGPHVALSVTDTGVGMDEEIRARIFEPFFNAPNGPQSGGGMGLAAVYGVVKQLGGSIWVTSRPELGTTFHIYLPRASS